VENPRLALPEVDPRGDESDDESPIERIFLGGP
jgi:hypothetical protein